MIASAHPVSRSGAGKNELQFAFLALLPRIETHARIYFRHVRCPHQKADTIQEMCALGWKWFLSLHQAGKDPADFMMSFTTFLARSVNSGRRLTGMMKSRDAMNPRTQKRHDFTVECLPTSPRSNHEHLYASPLGQELQDELEERLCDNRITPVPDQVQFKLDFPAWLRTLTPRERRIIQGMLRNERTKDLSKQFQVSPSRISQLRHEFEMSWKCFCGDLTPESEQGTRIAA